MRRTNVRWVVLVLVLISSLFPATVSQAAPNRPASENRDLTGLTPLEEAVVRNRSELAIAILSDWREPYPCLVRRLQHGRTLLHFAAAHGDSQLCLELIFRGAPLDTKDSFGNTPFLIAARFGHAECLAALALKGAKIDARNRSGRNALHLAVEACSFDAVKSLIRLGVSRDVRDEQGQTPLDLAGTDEIRQVLCQDRYFPRPKSAPDVETLVNRFRDDFRLFPSDRDFFDRLLGNRDIDLAEKRRQVIELLLNRGIDPGIGDEGIGDAGLIDLSNDPPPDE